MAAFSVDHVQRLTQLSKSQLKYWDRTGFFSPSYPTDEPFGSSPRFYSFRDIVGLRILGMLRVQNNVPLQHLRKVAEQLSINQPEHWARTKLYVLNRRVIFQEPGTGKPQEIVGGQYVIGIPLKVVIDDTRRDVDAMRQRTDDQVGHVEQSRSIARNKPVVAGTRIPVRLVQQLHEDGYDIDRIRSEYPDLAEADIMAAINGYAAAA
ncbi:DUF433 domain-containing protein [Acetobacteraceae bacterium]|nr:DUF433 domain-containing protein [Acetobacteraceae bacterium]